MGELVVEFVRGAQNNTAGRTDADGYLQAGTCCKHVAVYNTEGHAGGPSRMSLNVDVNARDLWETYLPAFQVWHRRPLAEMRRRCRRDAEEMQTRCRRDADEMRRWPSYSRVTCARRRPRPAGLRRAGPLVARDVLLQLAQRRPRGSWPRAGGTSSDPPRSRAC